MSRLHVRTLGPLEIRLDNRRLDLGTRKQRALMALLVINRRHLVSADGIVDALWGQDAPLERRKDVWVYVSRLRKALDSQSERLSRVNGGYVFDADEAMVDAARFEALAEEGRSLISHDPEAASLVLSEALAMWAGEAFGEFAIEDFALAEAARLGEARLVATERRIEADMAWKDPAALIPELQGLVTAHPGRPEFTRFLMLALYRRGRQADALAAYRDFAGHLAESGLEPPEHLRALEERVLLDDADLFSADRVMHGDIPHRIASFVGREHELGLVRRLMADHRLVTITGLGGVGKTTLAAEAARAIAPRHDASAMVDLTAVDEADGVGARIADAFRMDAGTGDVVRSIVDRIGSRSVLLLLDNCEQVARQAGEAAVELLRGCAGLRVLTTSRVVLGVPGEQVVALEPLDTAADGDAVALLTDRITALGAAVREAVDDDAVHTMAELTAGLPLAIELAAAQLRLWSAADVIAALEDPLEALVVPNRVGPDHHRELRASIAWSERLLAAQSVALLRRLAAFRSGFTRDAVAAVAGFEPLTEETAIAELGRLVESSLVGVQRARSIRFSMLEPVRQFAALRLDEAGEAGVVAERHARYYLDRLATLGPQIDFGTDPDALATARVEGPDIVAALRWAVAAGEADIAQSMTAKAVPWWRTAGNIGDAMGDIDAALDMSTGATKSRAELSFMAAPLFWLTRGKAAWLANLADLEAMAAELDDPEVSAWAALRLADSEMTTGAGPAEVVRLYRRAADLFREADSPRVVMPLHQLGWYLLWMWDRWKEVEEVTEEWLEIAEAHGAEGDVTAALSLQSWLALAQGDFMRLEATVERAAQRLRRLGDHRSAAMGNFQLAIGSLWQGDFDEAARRIEVSIAAHREIGATPWLINNLLTKVCIEAALGNAAGAAATMREVLDRGSEGAEPARAAAFAAIGVRVAAVAEPRQTAMLLGAAETLAAAGLHDMVPRMLVPALDAATGDPLPRLRRALGDAAFEEAWSEGTAMSAGQVLAAVADLVGGVS